MMYIDNNRYFCPNNVLNSLPLYFRRTYSNMYNYTFSRFLLINFMTQLCLVFSQHVLDYEQIHFWPWCNDYFSIFAHQNEIHLANHILNVSALPKLRIWWKDYDVFFPWYIIEPFGQDCPKSCRTQWKRSPMPRTNWIELLIGHRKRSIASENGLQEIFWCVGRGGVHILSITFLNVMGVPFYCYFSLTVANQYFKTNQIT